MTPAEAARMTRLITAQTTVLVRLAAGICGGDMVMMTVILRSASEAARSQAFAGRTDREREEIERLIADTSRVAVEQADAFIAQQDQGRAIARAALEGT